MSVRACILVSVLAVCCLGAAAAKHQLKIASIAPERSHWGKALTNSAKLVDKYSGGDVEIRGYHGGVQGDERTVLRKMRLGQLHGAVLIGQGVSEICPDTLALNLPFLFKDLDEARAVLLEVRPELTQCFSDKGFVVLGWPELGFTELYSKDRIRTLADFRQSKPWLIESDPLSKSFFEALKTQPVSTGAANVLTGWQSGLLKTVFTPPAGLITLQWHSRIRYRVAESITFAFGVVVVDKKRFDRLSSKQQNAMRKVFDAVMKKLNRETREKNEAAVLAIEKQGVETIRVSAEFKKAAIAASEKVAESMASNQFSAEILKKVRAHLDEYRRNR